MAAFLARPHATATAVVAAWQDVAPDAPDEFAATLLATVPGDVDQPVGLHLHGAMLGGATDTAAQLDRLVARAVTEPNGRGRHSRQHPQAPRPGRARGGGPDRLRTRLRAVASARDGASLLRTERWRAGACSRPSRVET